MIRKPAATASEKSAKESHGVPMPSLLDPPDAAQAAGFAREFGRRFLVTVDTEEEFDWAKPFTRDRHGLTHLSAIARFQRFCESNEVKPVYLVDYPVATSRTAADIIGPALDAGTAEIGIQLHPWVSPPFDEELSERLSFAGNLPYDLERAKFSQLYEAILGNFGRPPIMYRAGRYGLGPNTAQILRDHDIRVDSSVRAKWDYAATGGPNYRAHPVHPYWVNEGHDLLECPLTSVFTGPFAGFGDRLYPAMWRAPRLRGLLARSGLLQRIPLTPEGVTLAEARKCVDAALDGGVELLVASFHSPSLATGHTPYVQDEAQLDALYDWWRGFFSHCRTRGVEPASTADVIEAAR